MFQKKLLEKLRLRYVKGSLILLAVKNSNPNADMMHSLAQIAPGVVLGTIECAHFDFLNTTLEQVGSSRKLYIGDLAVRLDARRVGIASRLLEIVENYAKQERYDEIYLHVEIDNQLASSLYQNRGYEVLSNSPEIVSFTEQHLQRPADSYRMLRKQFPHEISVIDVNKTAAPQSHGMSVLHK